MRLVVLLANVILILTTTLVACGSSDEPTQAPPTESPQPTPLPPTSSPVPTPTSEPTSTPLSLSDLGNEFRVFVNEAYDYAIRIPVDWEITPRGASHANRVEVDAPGPDEIRGANIVPPLEFSISALDPEAGYTSLDDVETERSVRGEILEKVEAEVNGLPARRIHFRDSVYGLSLHYIIQRDDQFFTIDVYGYDQALIEPVLGTFGSPPDDLTTEIVRGQVQKLDRQAHMMIVSTKEGSGRPVIWFTDTEILPKGRLEGHIDFGDSVSAEGVVTDSGEIHATTITLQAPEQAGSQSVLQFRRMGGFAGFQDALVIFDDGTVRLQRAGKKSVENKLPEEQWKKVKNYISIFQPFAWHHEDNPGGPDNLVTDLDFYGTGKFEAAFDNQEEIVAYIREILTGFSK